LRFDHIEELAKFHRTMAVLEVRDHVAGLQFQGSEQRGRAVAL